MINFLKLKGPQDRRVMVERSDRAWSTGEGNGKPLQYSCLENPMNNKDHRVYQIVYSQSFTLSDNVFMYFTFKLVIRTQ